MMEFHMRVKDKEGIEDQKSSLKMLIFPSNCQFGSKLMQSGDENGTRRRRASLEPLNL